jgi:hypothetical protein
MSGLVPFILGGIFGVGLIIVGLGLLLAGGFCLIKAIRRLRGVIIANDAICNGHAGRFILAGIGLTLALYYLIWVVSKAIDIVQYRTREDWETYVADFSYFLAVFLLLSLFGGLKLASGILILKNKRAKEGKSNPPT